MKYLNRQKKLLCIAVVSLLVLFMVGAVWFVSWQQSQPQPPASSSSSASRAVSRTASSQLEAGGQTSSVPAVSSQISQPTVSDSAASSSEVTVQEILLTTYQLELEVGESQMPIVTMLPENASNKGEIWSTSNPSVANVTGLGLISGISPGSCTITVTSASNPSVSASVAVTVRSTSASIQPVEETSAASAASSRNDGLTYLIRPINCAFSYGLNEDGTYTLYWDDGHESIVSKEELDEMVDEAFQQAHPPQTFY